MNRRGFLKNIGITPIVPMISIETEKDKFIRKNYKMFMEFGFDTNNAKRIMGDIFQLNKDLAEWGRKNNQQVGQFFI